jgi:hypothetical protein
MRRWFCGLDTVFASGGFEFETLQSKWICHIQDDYSHLFLSFYLSLFYHLLLSTARLFINIFILWTRVTSKYFDRILHQNQKWQLWIYTRVVYLPVSQRNVSGKSNDNTGINYESIDLKLFFDIRKLAGTIILFYFPATEHSHRVH